MENILQKQELTFLKKNKDKTFWNGNIAGGNNDSVIRTEEEEDKKLVIQVSQEEEEKEQEEAFSTQFEDLQVSNKKNVEEAEDKQVRDVLNKIENMKHTIDYDVSPNLLNGYLQNI